ncbi:tetratricopeptide repeat protein [Microbacterium sp. ASV49]|uniref:Tetratricopeptide repeat protein n=1 Tax=Microbacterium candidum TaxID=3041922 RepID=A0ABT7N4J7_9MICO|nr:tetratricopeptide repeat protein [Microbacterium sp. ASV49]MDL9981568.1 tetratricopeptide repeat protein [Microbacterium sp. ASV49]
MTLDQQLDEIFAARDRNDMGPTIAALVPIYEANPTNARVLYEVGGAYDTNGDEELALTFYERAMDAGLSGDLLRRCYLQYGSTLRNLGAYARSVDVLAQARREFPDSASLTVWEAISLHADGRSDEAVASLLEVIADGVDSADIDRYKPALRGNAKYIRSLAGRD